MQAVVRIEQRKGNREHVLGEVPSAELSLGLVGGDPLSEHATVEDCGKVEPLMLVGNGGQSND